MSEEWGTPISKEKIIGRRNRLIEYQKTNQVRFTELYQIIDENILDINYMIYEIERLNNDIKVLLKENENKEKVIKTQDNIINELEKWLDKKEKLTFNSWNKGIHEVQRKLQELKGSDKE